MILILSDLHPSADHMRVNVCRGKWVGCLNVGVCVCADDDDEDYVCVFV